MASAKSPRLTHLALAALCASGVASAQADPARTLIQVRLQVLSACRVGVVHEIEPASERALAVRCSRRTPFAIDWASGGLPPLAGTGTGMAFISASWPMHERAAMPPTPPASTPTLHVAY